MPTAGRNTLFKATLPKFIKSWSMIESIITGVFFLSVILFFFGYAIYSAVHNSRF